MENHHGGKMQLSHKKRHTHTQTRSVPGIEMEDGGKFEEFMLWKSKQNLRFSMPHAHSVFLTPFLCVFVCVCVVLVYSP